MKLLPSRPNLNFLTREAKVLKSQHRNGDVSVCELIGHFDTSFHGLSNSQIFDRRFSILDAQRVVARQYGFASWTRLNRFVKASIVGRIPSDPTLKHLIQDRHEELLALQAEVKSKQGDYKGKYQHYKSLATDSANFLNTAFDTHGWPGPDVIGQECVESIYYVAANAVYDAGFQRRSVEMLDDALPEGAFWEFHYAALKDRYLTLSKRPTCYGITFGCYYDDEGEFQLHLTDILDPENVNKRRATAGYESYESQRAQFAALAKKENWNLKPRHKIENELNELSLEGGYTS